MVKMESTLERAGTRKIPITLSLEVTVAFSALESSVYPLYFTIGVDNRTVLMLVEESLCPMV